MQSLQRDGRELTEFVEQYARANALDADQARLLREKLSELLEWLKLMRRTLGYVQRYRPSHPSRQQSSAVLYDATRKFVQRFGRLALTFGPGETFSEEGFVLPQSLDTGMEGYTFFCLFRDGIVALTLMPGITPEELETLLEVVAANGRRDGDDAMTWLWSGRNPHLRIVVEPSMSPRVVAALLSSHPDDPLLGAYYRVLHSAGPSFREHDAIPEVARRHAELLRAYGLDPDRVERLLSGQGSHAELAPPGEQARAGYRSFFEDDNDRAARIGALRTRHLRPGG